MSGEASVYLVALVCLSATVVMNVIGLSEKRRSVLKYRLAGDEHMEDFVRGQFNSQLAVFSIIALAALTAGVRFILALRPSFNAIVAGQIMNGAVLLSAFVLQMGILSRHRLLLKSPFFNEAKRSQIRRISQGVLVVAVLTGLAFVANAAIGVMMQVR